MAGTSHLPQKIIKFSGGAYLSNASAICGIVLACANIEIPACAST